MTESMEHAADQMKELIEASSRLEKNVGKIYQILSRKFPEDRQFWWQLAMEEEHHSSLYDSFLRGYMLLNVFPSEIVDHDLAGIQKANERLEADLSGMDQWERTKVQFYEYALEIEQLASEGKFQQAMTEEDPSRFLQMVQRLNADNIRHKERIQEMLDKAAAESQSH